MVPAHTESVGPRDGRPVSAPVEGARPPAHTPEITDVWSWTARKYRIRATILLLVNVVLFCGLCAFTHWLRVGKPLAFRAQDYLDPLRLWGPNTQNLYDFILFPIRVDHTPMHGVVIGLLLAAIVAMPISVAILYRFRSALPFVAAVLVFAHMPWMAFTLLISCTLAAVRPFRMRFRYGSALLAMVPVLIYLFLATRGPTDPLSGSISPEERLLLIAPWVLAMLAACTMMAVVIFIARVVNHRPGAIAPVMAVMFATPALLFQAYIGVDELHYRVLEAQHGPRSERFEPVRDETDAIFDLVHRYTHPSANREPFRSALMGVWHSDPQQQRLLKQRIAHDLLLSLMNHRRETYEACKEFIADHPTSRYVPNVLFVQARALDTRLDERTLLENPARRELYTDFPHAESEPIWKSLLTQYPDSPLAVAARLRNAQLLLRHGDVAGALEALDQEAVQRAAEAAVRTPRAFLRSPPPETSLEYIPDQDLFELRQLRELILANRADPTYGDAPLQALATLDPHRRGYRAQLARLAHQYPDSLLYDNLVVRWASRGSDRELRIRNLMACLALFPGGDARVEALFELGELKTQAFGTDPALRAAGIERYRQVVSDFPQSVWAGRAAERLSKLVPRAAVTTEPAETP